MTAVNSEGDVAVKTLASGGQKDRTPWVDTTVAKVLLPTVTVLVLIALWQIAALTGVANEAVVPTASDVGVALWNLSRESFFWEATSITVQETLYGFTAGTVVAWVIGTLIGMSRVFSLSFYPIVVAFQIMPRVALAPLFLTWFGFGMSSKVVMAATICFFPVLIGVIVGLNNVDRDARTLMRSMGASRWQTYRSLSLPSSLPVIFAGIKTAMTLALIGAIVGEFIGASEGMGVLVKTFNFNLQIANTFAVIITLSILGLILYGLTELLEAKIVFWTRH
jgi:NitT/TauT family transport system permease protein